MNLSILTSIARYGLRSLLRRAYWLYRLLQAGGARNLTLGGLPRIEGKGRLVLGDHVILEKGVRLGVGKGGRLKVGQGVQIMRDCLLMSAEKVTVSIGDHCRLHPGTQCYVGRDWSIGAGTAIGAGCQLFAREPGVSGRLIIGAGSSIGDGTIIDICDDVRIGASVALGPRCVLYTHDHDYGGNLEGAAWKGGLMTKPIIIEKNAWIGANVTILPGVRIGERAVVAAGAVVTKDVDSHALYAGVPARKIRSLAHTEPLAKGSERDSQ